MYQSAHWYKLYSGMLIFKEKFSSADAGALEPVLNCDRQLTRRYILNYRTATTDLQQVLH
jgi:hypothetical protein